MQCESIGGIIFLLSKQGVIVLNIKTFLAVADFFAGLKDSPRLIAYLCIAAAALIAVIILLVLLFAPFKLTLYIDDEKKVIQKYPGFKAVRLQKPESREGYTFDGWYADKNFTKRVEGVYRMPMSGASLYAKWIRDEQEQKEEEFVSEEVLSAEQISVAEAEESAIEAEESSSECAALEKSAEEEPLPETEDEEEGETEEGDEIEGAVVTTVTGSKVFVQYRRSFTARLIQAADEIKDLYNRIRNELLSQICVKERVSWKYDSFNVGRKQFAKINANTKSLMIYFALDPASVDEKYNFRNVSEKKRYASVPVRYKVTGSRSFKYACELLEQTAREFGLDFKRVDDTQEIPYEDRETLIRRKLIKVYAKRDTGEAVTAEEVDEMIAAGAKVEKLSAYTVTDKVSLGEADKLLSDETAKQLIALAETREEGKGERIVGKRTYVNLDTISANYHEGETVTLDSLKAKGLVDKKAISCKILARGMLDKSLTVEATDFSLPAVKMIALTGGKVVKLKKY